MTMTVNRKDGMSVHPAADLFPMMTPEELQDLASSIVENGQLHPIVVRDGVLIDGRNRLAACKLVKVDPVFTELPDDQDPLAYIDAMDTRRNVNKGQRAMATAMRYPDAVIGRPGRGQKKGSEAEPFSKVRLSEARSVLRHSRSLALSVVNGSKPLDTALAEMKQAEQYQQSDEAKLNRLQESAPDLAEQVNEERLKINEAIAALSAREQELREMADRGHRAAATIAAHFLGAALAIFQARKSGEQIIIGPDDIAAIDEAVALLKNQ